MRIYGNNNALKICGPTCDEIIRLRRILHNVDLHNLYSLPDIIKVIRSRVTKIQSIYQG